jgi:patatin-related protein
MTTPSSPKVEHTKEVRFAVVMYGGVSLAIYINGIAQELLSLARSTGEAYEDAAGGRRSLSGERIKDEDEDEVKDDAETKAQKLKGTERVYRKLSYLLSDDDLLGRYKDSLTSGGQTPPGNKKTPDLLDDYLAKGNGDGTGPKPITTGFIIDILSGTSAGGINAIFLAKALANNQSIEKLKQLWVNEGDISLLINDSGSLKGLHLENQDPPKSLLNSRRMYLELLKAFDGMDAAKSSRPRYQSPYIKELDLFVTTTDIKGTIVPLQLSDKVVYEKRHRNVFHFKYGTEAEFGQECNHFLRKYNPFLAFAARCTSSFPFAFEPMRLCELDSLLNSHGDKDHKATGGSRSDLWKSFFGENKNVNSEENGKPGAGTLDFISRSYGDGGYLDNKPFSYATESLSHRQSNLPVERKLIYIEPSPEHPEDERQDDEPPNALLNAKAALVDLPTYETIREDLQRVLQRNRTFNRIARIVEATEKDLDAIRRDELRYGFKSQQWRLMDMAMMIEYCGIYFLPYRRLRIASVTDDLTTLVARVKNLDERSDHFMAVRALLRAWRQNEYVENYSPANAELVREILAGNVSLEKQQPDEQTYNAFLDDFDFSYRFRRLNFVLRKIDFLTRLATQNPPEPSESPYVKEAQDVITRAGRAETLACLSYLKCELTEVHKTLRTAVRKLQAGSPAAPGSEDRPPLNRFLGPELDQAIAEFYGAFGNLKLDEKQLKFVLGIPAVASASGEITDEHEEFARLDEERTNQRAEDLYDKDQTLNGILINVAGKLNQALTGKILKPTSQYSAQLLDPAEELPDALNDSCGRAEIDKVPTLSQQLIRGYLYNSYKNFDDYDQIQFPIFYQTEFGESAEVDVFRISPEDAPSLINERGPEADGRQKLAGNALFHFGAFLDRVWRENDIMWGRLDGAERLITALLPDPENGIVRDKLIGDAHLAILKEEMPPATQKELSSLLSQALIRVSSGETFEQALAKVVGPLKSPKVKQRLATTMRACLEDDKLRTFVKEHYKVGGLEPEPLLRSVARATQVTGKIFDELAKGKPGEKGIRWIARAGQLFWGLVEVAVPGSVANLLMFHWLKLLYLLEALLVVGGILFGQPDVKNVGWSLLALTFAINLAVLLLGDFMRGKKRWLWLALILLIAVIGFFAAVGADELLNVGFRKKISETAHQVTGGRLGTPTEAPTPIPVLVTFPPSSSPSSNASGSPTPSPSPSPTD